MKYVITLTPQEDDREIVSVEGDENFEELIECLGTKHQLYKLIEYALNVVKHCEPKG